VFLSLTRVEALGEVARVVPDEESDAFGACVIPAHEEISGALGGPRGGFRLSDRGRVAEGLRADLLLVDGDPSHNISDTLNTRAVWRRGTRLAA